MAGRRFGWRGRALEVTNVMDRIRESTGIYGLGFRKESILGLLLPLVIVGGIGVLAFLFLYVL